MKNAELSILAILVLAIGLGACKQERTTEQKAPAAPAAQPLSTYEKLLTVADVTRVTGLQGIQAVAQNPKQGIYGDLNFHQPDGTRVLQVNFHNVVTYEGSKADKNTFHAAVSGLGDEAFEGPAGVPVPTMLFVRKGDRAVVLQTDYDKKAETLKLLVTQEQLRELAQLIVSRF